MLWYLKRTFIWKSSPSCTNVVHCSNRRFTRTHMCEQLQSHARTSLIVSVFNVNLFWKSILQQIYSSWNCWILQLKIRQEFVWFDFISLFCHYTFIQFCYFYRYNINYLKYFTQTHNTRCACMRLNSHTHTMCEIFVRTHNRRFARTRP